MADTNFYRVFEDRHRGSRELIKSRLAVYLPFVLPLKQFYKVCTGIDLGCGRGEWLELLQERGFDVQGVDLDQGMLEVTIALGLKARIGDAVEALQSLESESLVVVSGFHLAEHLPIDLLQKLIQESLRVLKPGGVLILETPNPENLVVGTANFYLDPTHQRPIPILLLTFMVEHFGFERVKTLRLQESAGLANSNALALMNVLDGVSPDYAVVAQKAGAPELFAVTTPAFDADYGLSLSVLANNYDQQIKAKVQEALAQAQQATAQAQQATAQAQQATAQAQQATAQAQQAENALVAIYNSSSWRLTRPLRKTKNLLILLLAHASLYIKRRPLLKRIVLFMLIPFPGLKSRLTQKSEVANSVQTTTITAENLTPRARSIYSRLDTAINRNNRSTD